MHGIGKAIDLGIRKKGIRQKDLAKKMGVANNTISKWINGRTCPPGDKLIQLIKILEIKDVLFPPDEKEKGGEEVNKRLAERIEKLENTVKSLLDQEMERQLND